MTIEEYRAWKKLTLTELASEIGISQPYLTQLIKGLRTPSPTVAKAFKRATGGHVDYDDLYEKPTSEAVGS